MRRLSVLLLFGLQALEAAAVPPPVTTSSVSITLSTTSDDRRDSTSVSESEYVYTTVVRETRTITDSVSPVPHSGKRTRSDDGQYITTVIVYSRTKVIHPKTSPTSGIDSSSTAPADSSAGTSSSPAASYSAPRGSSSESPSDQTITSATTTTRSSSGPAYSPTNLVCPANDGQVYQAANGQYFQIECGVDHAGGDIGMVYVETFQQCIEKCAANSQCVDVSLSGAACYLKRSAGPSMQNAVWGARAISSSDVSSITSASAQAPPSDSTSGSVPSGSSSTSSPGPASTAARSCGVLSQNGSSYVDSSSVWTYTLACNSDLPGQGDFAARSSPSFEGCFALCAGSSRCDAFAYLGSICYLKSLNGDSLRLTSPSPADLAYITKDGSDIPSPVPQAPGTSCSGTSKKVKSSDDRTYTIKCGKDELGYADIGAAYADIFSNCFALCDAFTGCVGFAFASSTCYFKGSIGDITDNSNVDLAYLESDKPNKSKTTPLVHRAPVPL
ncbi:hypothetical protein ANO11243_048480 [Dothideomycetidae sp. 11243]|nr:hypothetical protein ANO11243_048480 [fungal sp. No.11243]